MTHKVLFTLYILLITITPLIWYPFTSELFEFNKMILIYLLTTLITTTWLIKMIQEKKFIFKTTPLDIPILFFLTTNILSTIFSIDPHISLFGYYSRSNGGLLSTISYLVLYYGLVSNFNKDEVIKLIKFGIFSGVVVALWAIPEHFGSSPSCYLLTQRFNVDCWQQDVTARVFATLGQPNWLAAYLEILIFPAYYFFLNTKSLYSRALYLVSITILYLAFTYAYSRGATLGLAVATLIFLVSYLLPLKKTGRSTFNLLLLIIAIFAICNFLFGSALTSYKFLNKFAAPNRESIATSVSAPSVGTQLENGGTESGTIRLIVWRGAWEIFKHNPILGSGVETFAYAYYQFRPQEHNLVSEWDFLYNKAHNEYLNYLATTGALGFISYLSLIAIFLFYFIRVIYKSPYTTYRILHIALLASYISYLIQNFFGFSVVTTALYFYLIPAFLFILSDNTKSPNLSKYFSKITSYILDPNRRLITIIIVVISASFFIISISKFWVADTMYARAQNLSDAGSPGKAYNLLVKAISLHDEPLYRSELAYSGAQAALVLSETDATLSAQMKDLSSEQTEYLLKTHPQNVSLFKNAIRTYFLLSAVDKKFTHETLVTIDQTIILAPTDPKLLLNKALVLQSEDKNQEAKEILQQALKLKPNYKEAMDLLNEL